MFPRALACAAVALLCAACGATGPRAAASEADPGAAAPAPAGPVAARFAPGLEALQQAVMAGDDELARALIRHVDSLGPDESTWQHVRAFERILDGRAAVQSLRFELVCVPDGPATAGPGSQPGAQAGRLVFRAGNTSADAIELRPGPATLHTTRTDVNRRGTGSSTQEARPFDSLQRLLLAPGATTEVELARFFLAPPPGLLAVRLDFELELRSGVLLRAGRELPAMHLSVAPARAARHAADLPEGALTPAELLAASLGLNESEPLLALAVRTEPGTAGAGLVELERALADLVRPRLELWIPSLRWLAGDLVPTDVDSLRGWLRERERARTAAAPRPRLVLPREVRAALPDGN